MLYFSWHRYEHQKFWPNLKESDYDSVGVEKGAGFNINVPWNRVNAQNSQPFSSLAITYLDNIFNAKTQILNFIDMFVCLLWSV